MALRVGKRELGDGQYVLHVANSAGDFLYETAIKRHDMSAAEIETAALKRKFEISDASMSAPVHDWQRMAEIQALLNKSTGTAWGTVGDVRYQLMPHYTTLLYDGAPLARSLNTPRGFSLWRKVADFDWHCIAWFAEMSDGRATLDRILNPQTVELNEDRRHVEKPEAHWYAAAANANYQIDVGDAHSVWGAGIPSGWDWLGTFDTAEHAESFVRMLTPDSTAKAETAKSHAERIAAARFRAEPESHWYSGDASGNWQLDPNQNGVSVWSYTPVAKGYHWVAAFATAYSAQMFVDAAVMNAEIDAEEASGTPDADETLMLRVRDVLNWYDSRRRLRIDQREMANAAIMAAAKAGDWNTVQVIREEMESWDREFFSSAYTIYVVLIDALEDAYNLSTQLANMQAVIDALGGSDDE